MKDNKGNKTGSKSCVACEKPVVNIDNEYVVQQVTVQGDLVVVDTVAELRSLSQQYIQGLVSGKYKGVQLLGYYTKGDTPAPTEYYLSDTAEEDDGGSVFEVGGIKLEHEFVGGLDLRYFGVTSEGDMTDTVNRAIISFARHGGGDLIVDENLSINVSSEDDRISSGIKMASNINLVINGSINIIPNSFMNSVIISCNDIQNFKITGKGYIRGDRHSHLVNSGQNLYWKQRYDETSYENGDYVSIDSVGFIVNQGGTTSSVYPQVSALEVGDTITDGTVVLEVVRKNQRIRYNNRIQSLGQWLWYNNQEVAVLVTQAGTTSSSPVTINNPTLGQVVTDGTVQGEVIHIGKIDGIGEWGMGITCYDCSNFEINGVTVENCWGDAIYLGGQQSTSPELGNRNFKILDVEINECRRQGISVLSARDFSILNLKGNNIFGTLPMALIDLEPETNNSVEDGIISNIVGKNTGGALKLYSYKAGSKIERVKINNVLSIDSALCVQIDRQFVKNIELSNLEGYNLKDYGLRIHRECENITVNGLTIDTSKEGITIGDNNKNIQISNCQLRNISERGINMYTNSEEVKFDNLVIDGAGQEAIFNKAVKRLSISNFKILNAYSGIYMYNGNIRDLSIMNGFLENIQRTGIYLNTTYSFKVLGVTFKDVGQEQNDTYFGLQLGSNTDDCYVADLKFVSSTGIMPKYCIVSQGTSLKGIIGLNQYNGAYVVADVNVSTSDNLNVQRLEIAKPQVRGIVSQTEPIALVEEAIPSNLPSSSATTIEQLVLDYNSAISNLNNLIGLTSSLKETINSKLTGDISSGQQQGTTPLITSLSFSPASGTSPYLLKAEFINKHLIDDVEYRLECRLATQAGSCIVNTFPGSVNTTITNQIKASGIFNYSTTVPDGSCTAVTARIVRISDSAVISQMTAHVNNIVENPPEPEPDPEEEQ